MYTPKDFTVETCLACSRLSVVGEAGKKRKREKKMREDLVLPRFFVARFRSSPTTESLEQAKTCFIGTSLIVAVVSL